ncbi:Hypothetical protein POVN_LOCUS137 [uncultured virus]|nr:Hypothetical protein POVN_LOCUS137 [uncultured virus]
MFLVDNILYVGAVAAVDLPVMPTRRGLHRTFHRYLGSHYPYIPNEAFEPLLVQPYMIDLLLTYYLYHKNNTYRLLRREVAWFIQNHDSMVPYRKVQMPFVEFIREGGASIQGALYGGVPFDAVSSGESGFDSLATSDSSQDGSDGDTKSSGRNTPVYESKVETKEQARTRVRRRTFMDFIWGEGSTINCHPTYYEFVEAMAVDLDAYTEDKDPATLARIERSFASYLPGKRGWTPTAKAV